MYFIFYRPRVAMAIHKRLLLFSCSVSVERCYTVYQHLGLSRVKKHLEASENCQEALVLEAVQHCLSWTALFTLLLLLLWPLLQNGHSKLIMLLNGSSDKPRPQPTIQHTHSVNKPYPSIQLVWFGRHYGRFPYVAILQTVF